MKKHKRPHRMSPEEITAEIANLNPVVQRQIDRLGPEENLNSPEAERLCALEAYAALIGII